MGAPIKATVHWVHLQSPLYSCITYAPANGPIDGRKNGPQMKRRLANPPAFVLPQTSRLVPAPIAIPADPKNPQRKRPIKSVAKFCAAPEPPAKTMMLDEVTRYSQRRPTNSDRGAMIIGPNANPNMYRVSERRASVRPTLNSAMRAEVAGPVTDAENVLQLITTWSAGVTCIILYASWVIRSRPTSERTRSKESQYDRFSSLDSNSWHLWPYEVHSAHRLDSTLMEGRCSFCWYLSRCPYLTWWKGLGG